MGKIENIIKRLTEVEEKERETLKAKDVPSTLIKRMEDLYGKFDYENDFFSGDLDTYYKTKSINPETKGINHQVIALASFEESLKQITSAYETLKDLLKADEAKNDSNIREIAQDIKMALNKYRAHLRKFYPEQYRKYTNKMNEALSVTDMINLNDKRIEAVAKAIADRYDIKDDGRLRGIIRVALSDYLEENTTTGGGAGSATFTPGTGMQYATPYAFKRVKKKKEEVKENLKDYIKISEPSFRKDKNNPNFLSGYIKYDTGGGSSMALGKETMSGQIRRLSSAEAVRQMDNIAKKLNDSFDIEDIEVTDLENGVVELFAVSDDFIDMDVKSELSTAMLNENMGEWPKELTSRYSDEYRFELEKVSPTYQDKPGRAKYRVIDIESGELKGTPVFEKPESLMAYADDLIKPQGGTQSSHFGTNEGTCGYGEDGKIGKKPAGPVDEIFPMGSSSSRDIKNKAARQRSSNKTANYHDLLKYYQFGIARIPRHKREKAGIPQAMHDRYGQEVWDILKKAYPNKGLSDTPPSDWRDSADELIMALGDEGNFEKTIKNPFYDIYAKLGPTDSHKKQLGIEEESDTDVGGGAKQAIGLDIDDEGASDAALDSEVNKMGYAESKEFNFKKMIKEALTPNYLK